MNLEQKNYILSFVEGIDNDYLPKYVYNFDFEKDGFETRIIQTFECLFRNVFLPENYQIYFSTKEKYLKPDFHALMTFDDLEIAKVRKQILKLTPRDCELLLNVNQDVRNAFVHGEYKTISDSIKSDLSKVLFKSLKNSYEYKTKKTLDLSFDVFFDAFKYTERQEWQEEKGVLQEKIQALQNTLALKIEKPVIKKVVIKKVNHIAPSEQIKSDKIEVDEEVKYSKVIKNDKYIIPVDLGRNVEYIHSSRIDISFDFLEKGWFDEAKKEAVASNDSLARLVVFFADNELRNFGDLLKSLNYVSLLNDFFKLLSKLPSKSIEPTFREMVKSFCDIKDDLEKKICVYKHLVLYKNSNSSKYKKNFVNFLIDSKEKFSSLVEGFNLYYSSLEDSEYLKSIISSFQTMLSKGKYGLLIDVKDSLLHDISSPEIIKLLVMAQAKVASFDEIENGLENISSPNNLSLLLNYDFYNNKVEFDFVLGSIKSSINAQISSIISKNKINIVVLLNTIFQYLDEKTIAEFLNDYVTLFQNKKVWTKYESEAILLLDLLSKHNDLLIILVESWFNSNITYLYDFYYSVLSKIRNELYYSPIVLRNDILLNLSFTNDCKPFSEEAKQIDTLQIENYLKYTSDYHFIDELIILLPKYINGDNSSVYARTFELLLPYLKEDEETLFNYIKIMAEKLVSIGEFDYAEKLYRYMLSLNINSSICYWGLLLCKSKSRTVDELAKEANLYENELFQATLHLSKDECTKIYNECLSVYSKHKEVIKKSKEEKKFRYDSRFTAFIALSQILCMIFCFIATMITYKWPFFLLAFIILGSMLFYGIGVEKRKNIYVCGILIFIFMLLAVATLVYLYF